MKILLIIQKPQLRGAEIFASQLGERLLQQGHDARLVSLHSGDAILPFTGSHIRLNRPSGRRFIDWSGWKELSCLINEFQPDVVQANAGDTLKFSVFSRLLFQWKAPIVFRNANKVSEFIDSPFKLWFNRFLVGRVRHVISVSELCRRDFVATYGLDETKTTMIPIGIDRFEIPPSPPSDLADIFQSRKVLLHVASFVPEKNHEGLLRIMERLVVSGEPVSCLLVGDGKLRETISGQVKARKLEDYVRILGFRRDVPALMAHARAVVLPSKIEGLPAVLLEAMYCGTPVLAYDAGGISEIVINGDTGWLVKQGDEEGFVRAILEVLGTADVRKVSDHAKARVTRDFDNGSIALRFADVYKRLSIK